MDCRVSVIMPALNEEQNIERAINDVSKAFELLNIQGEIIVINDGSTDSTEAIVNQISRNVAYVRMITHDKPQGIGASFWDGVGHATGKIVTMIPGDAENYSYEILRYEPLMNHVDLVVPFIFNPAKRTLRRRLLSKTYKAIINLSFGLLLNYMNGTVMYNRRVLENIDLRTKGFFFQTELLIKSIKSGYLYAEVPSALMGREEGTSRAVRLSSFVSVVVSFVVTFFSVHFSRSSRANRMPGTVSESRYRSLA